MSSREEEPTPLHPRPGPEIDPLAMTPSEMRRSGYAVVDMMINWIQQPDPILQRASAEKMSSLLTSSMPEHGSGIDDVIGTLGNDVFPNASRVGHPGYFAFIPGSTTWPAALADFMSSVANVYCGSWMESAGPSQVELIVIDWFRQWLGMPVGTDGVLVSGGSAANLTALAAARELRIGPMTQDAVIYCSDQAHSSTGRAARVLGFRPDQLHVVPSDDRYRLRPDALRAAIETDLANGMEPLAVCACAGSTNTGTIDPLHAIADLCDEFGIWLHVDAAYGGFAALTDRGSRALAGIERADSVTLDPHKWLQQPMECGALLVREPGALERAFGVLPDYLAEADAHGEEVNFSDRGLQLSRGARAIKVWASLSTFGISAFRSVVDSGLDLALAAQQIIEDDLELELMSPAGLGIVCFRRVVDGASPTDIARVNAWLASQLEATGRAMVSSTRLHGAHALRMCVMNHLTQESDVRFALDFLARTPIPVDMVTGGVAPSAPCPRGLESLLSDEGRRMLEGAAIRTIVPPGSPIFAQWSTGRDFYVVAHGRVRVAIDDEVVRHLGPGEFFGEIAAFDWGSGYGYVRTASVVADSTAEIVQVPTEVFARLMATEAPWREYVLSTRSRRLATL